MGVSTSSKRVIQSLSGISEMPFDNHSPFCLMWFLNGNLNFGAVHCRKPGYVALQQKNAVARPVALSDGSRIDDSGRAEKR